MEAYATSTSSSRNLKTLKDHGWRLLITPDRVYTKGFPYAIDNGAWGCFQRKEEFGVDRFFRLMREYGRESDWVVAPDIVAAGDESLAYSLRWLSECKKYADRILLAVQDGMTKKSIRPHLGHFYGLFIGGSTEWKLETMPMWGKLCMDANKYLHVARVNSVRRIKYCGDVGAQSFDGTSASRYSVTVPRLDAARRQCCLPW